MKIIVRKSDSVVIYSGNYQLTNAGVTGDSFSDTFTTTANATQFDVSNVPVGLASGRYTYSAGTFTLIPGMTPAFDPKATKNQQINAWRLAANLSTFPYAGKQIACDTLSRSDIDAVAGAIALTGAFPVNFPNSWKATDNTLVPIPDIATFKAMYAAMAVQGTANFERAQNLKATLAAAVTQADIDAIAW